MGAIYRLFLLVGVAGLLAIPAGASAQSCEAPPGTGAVDQYCETIPDAGGDRGASDPGPTRSREPLPASTRQALRSGSSEAQALGELLEGPSGQRPSGEAPTGERGGDAGRGGGKEGRSKAGLSTRRVEAPSGDPFSALTASIGQGGETVGGAFVWILVALTLLVLSLAWLRFRRRGNAGD